MKVSAVAKLPSLLVFLWLTLFSVRAIAAIDNAGILDNVLTHYANSASSWGNYITNRASWLFWALVVISMVITFGFMALRKADLQEFFAEFVRFNIVTGFFWWLLINGPTFATAIMDSLRRIGAEASGVPNLLAPSGIVDIGFDIFSKVVDVSSVWSPVDSLVGLIIAAIVLVVFALVGVNMLLLLVSGWMLAYAGIFFLGFGGSRWTSEIAIGYYKAVLNIAVQLCVMVMLVGIGKSFCDQYYADMSAGITLKELGVMLVVAIVLLALVDKVPDRIASIAGANSMSLGGGFGVGAAIGAGAMLGAGVASAGAALVGGAAGIAGGASALQAAFANASAAERAGGGANSMLSSSGGTAAAAGGSSGPGGASSGAGVSLAAAMGDSGVGASTSPSVPADGGLGSSEKQLGAKPDTGKPQASGGTGAKTVGPGQGVAPGEVPHSAPFKAAGAAATRFAKVAGGTVGNLAVGSWDVATAKLGDIHASAYDRVGETTGGKIAAAIKARGAGQKAVSFGEDSLSAGSESLDRQSEVASFRDRS